MNQLLKKSVCGKYLKPDDRLLSAGGTSKVLQHVISHLHSSSAHTYLCTRIIVISALLWRVSLHQVWTSARNPLPMPRKCCRSWQRAFEQARSVQSRCRCTAKCGCRSNSANCRKKRASLPWMRRPRQHQKLNCATYPEESANCAPPVCGCVLMPRAGGTNSARLQPAARMLDGLIVIAVCTVASPCFSSWHSLVIVTCLIPPAE